MSCVVSLALEVVGFDSEEQRRWWQVAVKRRIVLGSWTRGLGKFGVVFDSSGAEEECVSAVAAVKEVKLVVGSCPVWRR